MTRYAGAGNMYVAEIVAGKGTYQAYIYRIVNGVQKEAGASADLCADHAALRRHEWRGVFRARFKVRRVFSVPSRGLTGEWVGGESSIESERFGPDHAHAAYGHECLDCHIAGLFVGDAGFETLEGAIAINSSLGTLSQVMAGEGEQEDVSDRRARQSDGAVEDGGRFCPIALETIGCAEPGEAMAREIDLHSFEAWREEGELPVRDRESESAECIKTKWGGP